MLVTVDTTFGTITLELNEKKAPLTVQNFKKYVESKYYDNTLFHRVIDGFMIQGGGLNEDMADKPSKIAPINNEADNGLKNIKGSIAMARTMDPHSATSQFFVNLEDNAFLNHTAKTNEGWGYAVFGRVTSGMEVVNRIAKVETTSRSGHQDVPSSPIFIKSVNIVPESADIEKKKNPEIA